MDLQGFLALSTDGLLVYLLIFCRFSAMMITAPILSSPQFPVRARIGLALLTAMVLLPLQLSSPRKAVIGNAGALALAILGELVAGLLFGFLIMLVIQGIQFAGYMIALQMGFGLDQVFDPNSGSQVTTLTLFISTVATLVFLLVDGHHWLLMGLHRSLEAAPPGLFSLEPSALGSFLNAYDGMLDIVLTVMLPFLGVLLLLELALAIMNRVMPQLNVFVAGFPIKIGVGMLTLALGMPLLGAYFGELFTRWFRQSMGILGI